MAYPEYINAQIVIPKNMIDRDIADAYGFNVASADSTTYTMVRNRPSNIRFAGHSEFLASLPSGRIAEAEAAVRILPG